MKNMALQRPQMPDKSDCLYFFAGPWPVPASNVPYLFEKTAKVLYNVHQNISGQELIMADGSRAEKKPSIGNALRKNTKSSADVEAEILSFLHEAGTKPGTSAKPGCPLRHGLACVLATVHNNTPRATPVDFFCEGLTLWIAGEPGLKIRNVRSNPRVSIGIYHPMDHSVLNRSLQIMGRATLVSYAHQAAEFMKRLRQFGIYDAARKIVHEMFQAAGSLPADIDAETVAAVKRFNLIRVEPDEITFLKIDPAAGTEKNVWQRKRSRPSANAP